jgi:hypothetical protein
MSDLGFYLFASPLLLAALGVLAAAAVGRIRPLPENDKVALAWFVNYSVANLYFLWCLDYASQWRTGLVIFSTTLVAVLSIGQFLMAISRWRSGNRGWMCYLLLGAFLFQNLPITVAAIYRKTQGLSLI